MARTKLTPEKHDRVVSALREGFRRHAAAKRARVSERTVYRWLRLGWYEKTGMHADFHRAFYRAEREGRLAAARALVAAVRSDDWSTALAWLRRSFPTPWDEDGNSWLRRALRETQAAGDPPLADLWLLTWERLGRDLRCRKPGGGHEEAPLDEYDLESVRHLLAAAREFGDGPCVRP